MRRFQLQNRLRITVAAIIAVTLLMVSSLTIATGYPGICRHIDTHLADQRTECHHENDTCSNHEQEHRHTHDHINFSKIKIRVAQWYALLVWQTLILPPLDYSSKLSTRAPEKADQLRHHTSQVLLI